MERIGSIVNPYVYPVKPHQRVHGPAGYTDYSSYRPWLEDEFFFRCVYCLKRMVWAPTDQWVVDHLIPLVDAAELECEYDNLVFACQFCNQQKGSSRLQSPCQVGYGSCLAVEADGTVRTLNKAGNKLIKALSLNHSLQIQERTKTLGIIASLAQYNRAEYTRLMGYPQNLPDLRKLRPPRNDRNDGLQNCHLARWERGELAAVY